LTKISFLKISGIEDPYQRGDLRPLSRTLSSPLVQLGSQHHPGLPPGLPGADGSSSSSLHQSSSATSLPDTDTTTITLNHHNHQRHHLEEQQQQIQQKLIHLDAQTHGHLQKVDPAQRQENLEALQKKQRNIILSQQVAYPPRGVPGTPLPPGAIIGNSPRPGMQHIVIRGQMPAGLNQQQTFQWLQQGGSRPLLVRLANAPGLSPLTPLTQQGFVAGVPPQQRPDEVNPDPNLPITEELQQEQEPSAAGMCYVIKSMV
jgi:hypothetical protein